MLKNLSTLNSTKLKYFLDSIDVVLCDCDGVIWRSNTPITGAKETVTKLKKFGKQVHFVSNNSTSGVKNLNIKLNKFGITSQINDIAVPSIAITSYLKKIQFNKEIFLLGNTNMKEEFENSGFIISKTQNSEVNRPLQEIIENIHDAENIGAVVFDIDFNISYSKIIRAQMYLKCPDVLFIIGATDKSIIVGPHKIIGQHSIQMALQDITKTTPLHFGKPASNFNNYIIEKFNIKDPSRVLFVGDSLEQDIQFGTRFGYHTLLVLSGVTNFEDVRSCREQQKIPEYYLNSLGDLCELIKNKLNI